MKCKPYYDYGYQENPGWLHQTKWVVPLITSRMVHLIFIVVPGHAGVQGNEHVDYLADTAVIMTCLALERSDVVNATCDTYREDKYGNRHDLASISKLVDMGVHQGAAGHKQFTKERTGAIFVLSWIYSKLILTAQEIRKTLQLASFGQPRADHYFTHASGRGAIPTATNTEEFRRIFVSIHEAVSREVGHFLDNARQKEASDVIKKLENVKLIDRYTGRKPPGILYLTATHLIFVDAEGRRETWILHMHIGQIEKQGMTAEGCPLQLRCKNFLCVTFIIPRERDCVEICQSLMLFSRPAEIDRLYAFSFTSNENLEKTHGWDMFDLQSDFVRMGVSNENWVATHLNKQYELCDTYPSLLYVPTSATTHVLVGSSKFRSRGRFPVLSYLHSANQAALSRCSQPLSGFSARCMEDEKMLQSIMKANPKSDIMYVVDTRPMINAVFNLAQGKGYEKESFYSNIKFQFIGIENIHVMRASLQKLMEISELKKPTMNEFLSRLEGTGWLKHISAIIDTSVFIAKAIADGVSVLVHCSDGWDRTAQTCSLAQLMLDPYYRTLQGFMALIEKEWLSFGHKFTDRCGFLDSVDSRETSPVFTQFLECVWQIMHQFPCAFQFNERFLHTIHDHAYSCQFGTFIGNCEKDRLDLRLFERTYSLWGFLSYHSNEFLNPMYKKTYEMKLPVIIPNSSPQAIKFWKGMYNRFDNGLQPREHVMDIISAARDHSTSLEDHAQLLEKRVTQICKLLGKSDETIYRKLQGFPSMDSIDGFLSSHIGDGSTVSKSSYQDDSFHKRPSDSDSHFIGRYLHLDGLTSNHIKSDSESGFDESSSQMSRSGFDDGGFYLGMDASTVKRSHSADHITMEQLITEMKTVAIVWKSFCKVQTCSCATPLEYHVKKYHCWKCGDVFCIRCIAKKVPLPGHYHRRPVAVCKPCYKELLKMQAS